MGNLEYKEITTDGPEIEPMNHNMQIRKSEPQVHWLIAGVMSQRPSPNVAGSAVGQGSGQVEKLLFGGPLPFFNQLVLVSCISCVRRVKKCSYTARAEGFMAKEHFVRLCGGP